MNIGFVSLGCAKNQVDTEEILMYLKRNGMELTSQVELADIIIINTCAFIESAKKEAIDTILEMAQYKKPLIVIGCLAQRYAEEIKQSIPEISLVIPIRDYDHFGEEFQKLIPNLVMEGKIDPTKRIYTSKDHEAYLRISEGCNNFCTFCAIPLIRGRFHSVPLETLKAELDDMAKNGIKSVTIISQDTTKYGTDIGLTIIDLLKEVCSHEEFEFVKLMYLYPDEITDELINFFKDNPKLTPYFDLPLQHGSNHILRLMARRGSREQNLEIIKKFKSTVRNAILRTTMLLGFPGETEEDFNETMDFIKEIEFDHMGAFIYSREEGTRSYDFPDRVNKNTAKGRYNKLMKEQAKISYRLNKQRLGKKYKFMVQEYDEENMCYYGVSDIYAPDDIDGKMYVYSNVELHSGDLIEVEIINVPNPYDLEAKFVSFLNK